MDQPRTSKAPPADQRGGLLFEPKKVLDIENTLAGKRKSVVPELTAIPAGLEAPALLAHGARSASAPRRALGSSQTTFEHAELQGFCSHGAIARRATNGSEWTPPESERVRRRRELYRLREWWRRRSERPRQARCGRTRVATDATLTVRDAWDRAGAELRRSSSWSGVETCASVWGCPVCSVRVRSDRSRAIAMMDRWAREEGWQVSMLTLTISHAMGDDLRYMRTRMAKAWARIQRLTTWRRLLGKGAVFVRALEATYGQHGWHSHYHILVLSPVALDTHARPAKREEDPDVQHVNLASDIATQWRDAVLIELGARHMPDLEHGTDWREIGAGEYLAKLDLAMGLELTDAAGSKRTKGGGRKPGEILRDARAHDELARKLERSGHHHTALGEHDAAAAAWQSARLHRAAQRHDTAVYHEYERATVGARLHTATAGLLAFWQAEADAERDEECITAHVLSVPGELYDLLRDVPDALATMAAAAEEATPIEAVAEWLRSLGTRAIQRRRTYVSAAGWHVRDEETRTLHGPTWAAAWLDACGPRDGYLD